MLLLQRAQYPAEISCCFPIQADIKANYFTPTWLPLFLSVAITSLTFLICYYRYARAHKHTFLTVNAYVGTWVCSLSGDCSAHWCTKWSAIGANVLVDMPAFTDQDWIDLHAMSVQHFPIIFSWQSAMSKVCKHFRQIIYFVPSGWLRIYVNITLRWAKGKPRWNLSYFWSLGFRSKSHISHTWQTFRDSFQTDIVWNVGLAWWLTYFLVTSPLQHLLYCLPTASTQQTDDI